MSTERLNLARGYNVRQTRRDRREEIWREEVWQEEHRRERVAELIDAYQRGDLSRPEFLDRLRRCNG